MSEYKLEHIDNGVDKYEKNIPYSTSARKFQVGKAVLTLMTLTVPSTPSNVEARPMSTTLMPYDTPCHYTDNVEKKQVAKSLMLVPKSVIGNSTMQQENEIKLKESFLKSCKDVSSQFILSPVFNFLAKGLKELNFKRVFVDVVPSKAMIDVNLNLGHKILLSVSKSLSTISDESVNFSISVDGEIRTISKMSSLKLIQKMKVIQRKLSE